MALIIFTVLLLQSTFVPLTPTKMSKFELQDIWHISLTYLLKTGIWRCISSCGILYEQNPSLVPNLHGLNAPIDVITCGSRC